jgi:hypothetical protein
MTSTALALVVASGCRSSGTAASARWARGATARVAVTPLADGGWLRTTVDQRFLGGRLAPAEPTGAWAEVVVQQTLRRHERSGFDDDDVTLESRAWIGPEAPAGEAAWTLVDHAESGRIVDSRWYVTHLPQLGTTEELFRYYDLATGAPRFATSDALLEVPAAPGRTVRAVAYLAAATAESIPCGHEGDLGWLHFVHADGKVTRVMVSTTAGQVPPFNPRWGFVDARSGTIARRLPVAAAGRPVEPLVLALAYDDAVPQVLLPLGAGGRAELETATLAPAFTVEPRECAGTFPHEDDAALARHRASRGPH